jgi:O-antigen/teichoic acid export membrane protein
MSRTRKAAVTAAFSYAQFAVAIVPGLVLVPLTLKCLGARTYGLWLTVGELLTYVALVDPGVVGVLPWMVAEADGASDRRQLRRLISNGVAAGCLAGLGYVVVAFVAWTLLPARLLWPAADRAMLGPPLALLVVVTAITYPLRAFRAALLGMQDAAFVGGLAIAEVAVNAVMMATMLIAGYQIWAIVVAAACSSTMAAFGGVLRLGMIAPDVLRDWERPTCRDLGYLLRNGTGAWLSGFGWHLISASNNIVIAYLGHPEWVPVFNCTAKSSLVLMQMGWVMPDSGLVGLAQLHGERPRSERLRQMVGALIQLHLLIAGAAACAVLAFNPIFVGRWVGDAFFGGLSLNALLAASLLLFAAAHGLISAASVVGNRLRVGIVSIVNGIAQLACAVLFGRRWGLSGVAAAALVATAVTGVVPALAMLQTSGALSWRALTRQVVAVWMRRAAPLLVLATMVGVAYRWLGPWMTGAATLAILLSYVWQMRPMYRVLPLDPRWVGWLVSLRLMASGPVAAPAAERWAER